MGRPASGRPHRRRGPRRGEGRAVSRRVPPSRSVDHRTDRAMGLRGDQPRARRDQRRRRRGLHRERDPHRGGRAGRRDAAQVRQRRAARRTDTRGARAHREGTERRRLAIRGGRNTKPQADGETRCGAATARWSRSSRATAFSTTCPARRPVRSEPTSRERCPTRRRRSSEATALFDDVWYGDAPTGPSETERLRSLSDAVLEKAAR